MKRRLPQVPVTFRALGALGALVLGATTPAFAARDPEIRYRTLETAHFKVTYGTEQQEIADHVADLAEDLRERLGKAVGFRPSEKVEILLTDETDDANGSATAIPYDAVRLYLTAPDDLSPLGDVDNWYTELLTHEYTHIVHVDQMSGLPVLVNKILGKTYAPNQVQPRWILEGLAVLEETKETSGGRLRSSIWDMYLRTDFLEGNIGTLDQMCNYVRRWPQGNIWYLYGSHLWAYVVETYGEDVVRKIASDYGANLLPWGINRSAKRATGKTWEELYDEWVVWQKKKFQAAEATIVSRGLREGVRLTTGGQSANHPRWIPKGSALGNPGDILYFRDDGHDRSGLWRLPVTRAKDGGLDVHEADREVVVRTAGEANFTFAPSGDLVFHQNAYHRNLYAFNDLFRLDANTRDASGLGERRERLTDGVRAQDPAVSPDGHQIVFVGNHRGTRTLYLADYATTSASNDRSGRSASGTVSNIRVLGRRGRWDQAFSPAWSPDGKHVAYSHFAVGGYKDIRIVDVATGATETLFGDRAIESGPTYSADGKQLYFHSDRTGVFNVYRYTLATGELKQVTNVRNGAFFPQISPDGRHLLYLGYTHTGFDTFAMPLDESRLLPAPAYVDPHPKAAPPPPPVKKLDRGDYNPLSTLAPRAFNVRTEPGNFGQAFTVDFAASDLAAFHEFSASARIETALPGLQGSVGYSYHRLPFDTSVRLFRSLSPRGNFPAAGGKVLAQETTGAESSISWARRKPFDGHSVYFSYSYQRVGANQTVDLSRINPYDPLPFSDRGYVGVLHANWSYSNAEGYLWGTAPERGFSVSANMNATDPWLGTSLSGTNITPGDVSGFSAQAEATAYWRMPWFRHHSLATHIGGGTSVGSYPGRSTYYLGGFLDLPIVDTVQDVLLQGGIQLRGYPVYSQAGRNYTLVNAEYRFPIVNVDRGLSTIPLFLNRINGAFFVDYGAAYDSLDSAKWKTGVGTEAWIDTQLGYHLGMTFRVGYARGLASGGINKTYFVAAIPY
jgi:hypothetical protein